MQSGSPRPTETRDIHAEADCAMPGRSAQGAEQRTMNERSQNEKTSANIAFTARGTNQEIEQGLVFQPKFDRDGLIAAIVTDAVGGRVLMFAWMNSAALAQTLETKTAHFWSRSRQKLWQKGEESGNLLDVVELRTDCDQDVLLVSVHVRGAGVACHTGTKSCFYRTIESDRLTGQATLRRKD